MPTAVIDGIKTNYDVFGSGPPLLMYSPAGFNAAMETWRTQGIYAKVKFLDHLPKKYTCIAFDRRECGQSGGCVERITWAHYVAQGKGLLDHLGFKRAHIMGGCMGVSCAAAFGVINPETTLSLVLYWPVGGAKYRLSSHQRFAEAYAKQNVDQYKLVVAAVARTLFDRDTAPGAEPEDLMRLDIPALIVPGRDAAHATSAARYLEECLPRAQYWDVPVDGQTEAPTAARVMEFLEKAPSP